MGLKYRPIELIGRGGMAEVSRALLVFDDGVEREVAIKSVLPHLRTNSRFLEMFEDEARLAARLVHPNIVRVFGVGRDDGETYLVMEYIEGIDLQCLEETIWSHGRQVPVALAVHLINQILAGLQHAHSLPDENGEPLNIIHRDVSPGNFLLSTKGAVKITDFGMAKARTQQIETQPGFAKGKLGYLAPEVIEDIPIDHRVDVYGAGLSLWEMLAGRPLYIIEDAMDVRRMVLDEPIPSLVKLNPKIDKVLQSIAERAIDRDREQRYADVGHFRRALEGYLAARDFSVRPYHVGRLVNWALEAASPNGGDD